MIAIGSDHGGFELKEKIKKFFDQNNIKYHDYGTNSPDSVDFPDYAKLVCESILDKECEKGILICGTGIGMSIAANKFSGINCALCSNIMGARLSREHNNSNVLALGGRVLGEQLAIEIIEKWLNTSFLGGKYAQRNDLIKKIELQYLGGK